MLHHMLRSVGKSKLPKYIALVTGISPYINVYPWSSSGFGTKFANPSTLPTGGGYNVAFSLDGAYIAVAHDASPYISVYPWSSSGFGTKLTAITSGHGNSVNFSPNGAYLALGSTQTSPYFDVYSWSSSGFGGDAGFTDPTNVPTDDVEDIKFSPDGNYLAMGHINIPYISVYPFSDSGFGTRFTAPSLAAPVNGVDFGV